MHTKLSTCTHILFIRTKWTRYSALLTPRSSIDPHLQCSVVIKFHNITWTDHTPYTIHTIQTQHALLMDSMHSFCMHTSKTDHICHAQYSNLSTLYIAATHNITQSSCTSTCTPSTTHHTLPQPSAHNYSKPHKAYLCKWQQKGTRCRDGVKVLWCHSHLVRLVF